MEYKTQKTKYKGVQNPFFGKTHTEETKEKIKQSLKKKFPNGRPLNSGNWKKGRNPWNAGKACPTISIAKMGHNVSIQTREKIRHANLGKIMSEETKKKLSLKLKGKKCHTEEFKKKQSILKKKNNPAKRPEVRKKIKEARAKQKNTFTSSIEVKIQNFLKELGIEYFTHQYMKIEHGYQCDVLIPSINLVIECDGDYWHKYPVGREIDHIRTSELLDKGFKVLRLWEYEIKAMTINEFEEKLK